MADYLFIPASNPVRNVSLTKSIVGTTIDANDCPGDGSNDGTWHKNKQT